MKKLKILLLALAATISVGAWAQEWAAPIVPGLPSSDWDGSTKVYMYNVDADAFTTYGMNWGTQAIATRLASGDNKESSYHPGVAKIVDGKVRFILNHNSSSYIGGNTGTERDCWVDFGRQGDFTFTQTSTNVYTLALDASLLDTYWAYGGQLTLKSGKGNTHWAFIPVESITNNNFALYKAKKELYAVYQQCVASGVTTKYAEQINTAYSVYSASEPSIANIKNATATLIKAVGNDLISTIPANFLFTNTDMAGAGTASDWGFNAGISGGAFENYHNTFNLTQTTTDLPSGTYVVKFHAFYRNDDSEPAPKLTLTSGSTNVSQNIPCIADINFGTVSGAKAKAGGSDWNNNKPNSQAGGGEALPYEATTVTAQIYVEEGTLTISVNQTNKNQWVLFQGFDIQFTSNASLKTEALANAEAIDQEKPMNKTVLSALQEKIQKVKDAKTVSEITSACAELNTAVDNAKASIAIYEKVAALNAMVEDLDADGQAAYSETLAAYNGRTLEMYEDAYNAYLAAVKAQTTPGADMTGAINNWDFLNCTNGNFPGWTIYAPNGGNTWKNGDTRVEYWIGSAKNGIFKYYQEITGLPAGKYKLSASMQNYTDNEEGASFGVGETGVYGKSGINTVWGIVDKNQNSLDNYETPELTITNGNLELGVGNKETMTARWFVVDNIKLTLISRIQLSDYYDLIQELITTAEAIGLHNATIKAVLDSKVEAATAAIAEPAETDIDKLNKIIDELTDAIKNSNESAAIYVQIANVNEKAASLDSDGQKAYSETLEKYNNGELSTLAEAQAAYIAAVKAQTTSGANMTDIITNAAVTSTMGWNDARVNSGQQYTGAPDNTYFDVYNEIRNMTQNIGVLKSGLYTLKCATRASADMTKAGNIYVLQNGSNLSSTDIHKDGNTGGSLDNGWSWTEVTFQVTDETNDIKIGFYAECDGYKWAGADNFTLTFVGKTFDATLTQIGDAAYSSMYLDFPVEIPENVEAYYVTVSGKTATMNPIEDVIPANCGVILKAAKDVDKVTFTQTSTEATTDVSSNVLIGFVVDTEVAASDNAHYAFSYKTGDTKPAFYIPESAESDTDPTSKFTAKAHKAYIELEGGSASKFDITWGGEATGINTIDNGQLTIDNSKAYNLNGMRVSSNYKGIVLKGGKKFLQK